MFNCAECPKSTQKVRRCREDRWDFTSDDSPQFPQYVVKGGNLYGFCPGKATWDNEAVSLYQTLVVCAETGIMLESGGLSDQPSWFVETLSWFLPLYSDNRFYSRARAILGDGKDTKKGMTHGNNRR